VCVGELGLSVKPAITVQISG